MTKALGTSEMFQLYVHRNGGSFVGLCAELREVIEGSSAADIIVKTRALIDSVSNYPGARKPRLTVRMSPNGRSFKPSTR